MSLKQFLRKPLSITLLSVAALPTVVLPVAAADSRPEPTLPEVVVTATRTPVPFEDTLADVTLIDEETIARSGAASLADLLARQPGLEIARNGGVAATTSLFIRGTNSGHALVLIDGVRTASLSTGTSPLEAIPLSDIERIEILRGAASMLYGADALGGVVQIFTRGKNSNGKPLSATAEAACGSYSTCTSQARAAGKLGAFNWSVSAGVEHSKGFNAIDNPDNYSYVPDRDGYRNDHQRASLQWAPNDRNDVTLSLLRDSLDTQIDAGDGSSNPANDRSKTLLSQINLNGAHQLTSAWTTRWQWSSLDNDSKTLSWGDTYRYRTRSDQYLWQNEFNLASWLPSNWLANGSVMLAVEHDTQRLDGSTDYDADSRDTNAVTAGYRWRYQDHTLQLSGRYDHTGQYGGQTNGGISYGYKLTRDWQLTASAGTAFKAPSFNDLYYPGYGNPDLLPEKSRSFELGTRYNFRLPVTKASALNGEWRATLWDNNVRDLIVSICDQSWLCRPENAERARLQGLTLATLLDYQGYRLDASFDWQSPRNTSEDRWLPRRARVHGSATLGKTFPLPYGALYNAVNVTASGKRYDDSANTTPLGGYSVVNLVTEWQLPPVAGATLTVFARANNLFDKDYALAADYATGGFQAMAGLRGQW